MSCVWHDALLDPPGIRQSTWPLAVILRQEDGTRRLDFAAYDHQAEQFITHRPGTVIKWSYLPRTSKEEGIITW